MSQENKRRFIRSGTGLNFPVPVPVPDNIPGAASASGGASGSDSENTDKNQTSLAMGSSGYRELLADRLNVDDKSIVGAVDFKDGGALGHVELAEGELRESDEFQAEKESPVDEHVAVFSDQLRDAAQMQRDTDKGIATRKYRNRMAKLAQYEDTMKELERRAAATPGDGDDKRIKKLGQYDCDDLPEIQDDSVTVEDFLPRSAKKYL